MTSNNQPKKKKTVYIILGTILVAFILCFGAVWMLFKNYMSKIDFDWKTGTSGDVQVDHTLTDDEIMKELLADEEDTGASDSPQEDIEKLESQMQEQTKDHESEDVLLSSEDVFNILLVGCDSRKLGGAGRSDAIVLVSINKESEKIHLTSIMRDCYVAIPGRDNNRINAAYAFGGGSLLMSTVETNFAVDVDKYVAFDFCSFIDVVDSVGGVEIDVSEEEREVLNGLVMDWNAINGKENVLEHQLHQSGLQQLNGIQALCYSRIRRIGNGDFERTERQHEVIGEIFKKVKDLNLLEMNDLLNILLPEIKTNLKEEEIMSLLLKVMDYLSYDMDSMRIPVEGSYESLRVNKMAVIGIDLEKNQKAIEEFIYH